MSLSSCHMSYLLAILDSNITFADFFNWNRVKIRYCDGASFSGDSQNQVSTNVCPCKSSALASAQRTRRIADDMTFDYEFWECPFPIYKNIKFEKQKKKEFTFMCTAANSYSTFEWSFPQRASKHCKLFDIWSKLYANVFVNGQTCKYRHTKISILHLLLSFMFFLFCVCVQVVPRTKYQLLPCSSI